MPLRVKCPAGHALIVPDDRAGRTLRCPRCGESVVVPGGRESGLAGQGSGFRVQGSEEVVEKAVATLLEARFPQDVVERPPPEPVVKPKSRVIAKPLPPPPPAVEVAAEPEPVSPASLSPRPFAPEPEPPEPVPPAPPPPLDLAKEPAQEAAPVPPELPVPESVVESAAELPPEPDLEPAPAIVPAAIDPAPPPLSDASNLQPAVSAALHADANRTLAVYQLAAALALVALFSVAPAVWDVIAYLHAEELDAPFVARWALVLFFLGVVQLAYAVYLFQLPDWTSVWVVTLWLLALAFGYAGVLGLVLISQADGFLVGPHGLQLADKLAGGEAALWCLCMVSLATILAFFAGRMSVQWRKAERMLRVAGY